MGLGGRIALLTVVSACSRSGLKLRPCVADSECPGGEVCRDGACEPGDVGCGMEDLGHDAPPNVVILLDRSSSMTDPIDGVRKWDIAVDSLEAVLPDFDGRVRFGLMMFPGPTADCTPGQIDVDVGDDHAEEVLSALPPDPLVTTPIGSSLSALRGYGGLDDASRGNFVLLISDGFESCGGDPIARAAELAVDVPPVRIFVVGFGDLVDAVALTDIAQAAGTARGGERAFFRAGDREELSEAIAQVSERVLSCDFELETVPPDPGEMYVFLDDEAIPRDARSGWEYDVETNAVRFFGEACDEVREGASRVRVVFGCP